MWDIIMFQVTMLEGFVFVTSLVLCCPSGDVLQSTWSFDLDDTSNDIFLCWSYEGETFGSSHLKLELSFRLNQFNTSWCMV